jgi:hypothetical protein
LAHSTGIGGAVGSTAVGGVHAEHKIVAEHPSTSFHQIGIPGGKSPGKAL